MASAPVTSTLRGSRSGRAALIVAVAFLASPHLGSQTGPAKPGPPAIVTWKVVANAWARPAVDGDSVFFLSRQHDVTAVKLTTGAVRWRQKTGEPDAVIGAGITVASGLVIAGDYNVTAFDRTTGETRWRFVPQVGWAPGAYLGGAQDGVVFAGSGAGRVYAIDALSGAARWTTPIGDGGPMIVYEPIVSGDMVFATFARTVAPAAGGVVALDVATGIERWRTTFPTTPAAAASFVSPGGIGSPVAFEQVVIAANRDGIVYAFRRADGSTAWILPSVEVRPAWLSPGAPTSQGPPAQADGRALARSGRILFVSSNTGYLIAYDLDTRREKWRYLADVNYSLGPQLGSDAQYVYVPSWSGRLASVNITNGTEHWRIGDWKDAFLWPPVVAGNMVYASSATGLHALRR